jgi:hypothetical protein
LNPPQPAAANYFVPGHWHLRVSAENVGFRQLGGDSLLAGINDFGVRRGRRDLRDVLLFYWVTQHDTRMRRQSG